LIVKQVLIMADAAEVPESLIKDLQLQTDDSSPNGLRVISPAQYPAVVAKIDAAAVDTFAFPKVSTLGGRTIVAGRQIDRKAIKMNLTVTPTVSADAASVGTAISLSIDTGQNSSVYKIGDNIVIPDGHTLISAFTNSSLPAGKSFLLILTPRIIYSAGNPVHSDTEISSKH
jgi:hypothetical protein